MIELSSAFVPLVVLVIVLASDVWVYQDALAQNSRGTPVFFRFGTFTIDTPAAWFIACLILWIIFFPLYFTSRSS